MAILPTTPYDAFMASVEAKFGHKGAPGSLGLKFKDEDGEPVSIRDESDYELAIETARESAKGGGRKSGEGRLEIWIENE